jgi:acetylornithine deacetylase/succinyl-diaminopimelate desuccinylase family protein
MIDTWKIKIQKLINDWKDEMPELCRELIKIKSVCGINAEEAIAEKIRLVLDKMGINAKLVALSQNRPNVFASIGDNVFPSILFVGHIDTVPVGEESNWTHSPFEAIVADNRIYGRGAIDMKSGIVAAIYAARALLNLNHELEGTIKLAFVVDEESGAQSEIGLKYLLSQNILKADGAVYTYPGLDCIRNGHRGYIRFKLVAEGEAWHTGAGKWERKERGCNAVTGLAEVLIALERLEWPESKSQAFLKRKCVCTPGVMISGGIGISIVPNKCEAWVDIRTLPDQDSDLVMIRVQEAISNVCSNKKKLKISIEELHIIPAVELSAESKLIKSFAKNAEIILEKRPRIAGAGPANEGYMLIKNGIPTICGFGPQGNNAHASNEYVEIESIWKTSLIYALSVIDFFHSLRNND